MQSNTKNPPWARSSVNSNMSGINPQLMDPNIAMGQQGIMPFQQSYNTNMMQAQGGMAMPIGGQLPINQMSQGQMYGSNVVAYPTPRAVNPGMYGGGGGSQGGGQPAANEQRVFTGTVTKTHNDFGFVDHDVFYQTSVCSKGQIPKVQDRVLVEATYNPNMPFKWNATRVQVLPKNSPTNNKPRQIGNKSSSYNAVPPPAKRHSPHVTRRDDRPAIPRREDRKRSRSRSRSRSKERKDSRRRDSPPRKRAVVHQSSPPGRGYVVRVPKIPLDVASLDVPSLSHRYANLYIPSDFFSARVRWGETFPPQSPFPLSNPCVYHIMNKEAEAPIPNDAVLEPADADYRFYAKVMLISIPTLEEMYKRCGLTKADEKDKDKDKRSSSKSAQHPTRLIKFLVGQKGKTGENFAIGGPWSPSLDGPNPDKDPSVLVKTAIRTCKALTGVDLSACTQWYRMVEFYYWRESTSGGKSRLETVVLFLPDIWSALAAKEAWANVIDTYKSASDAAIRRLEEPASESPPAAQPATTTTDADQSQIDTSLEDSTITIDEGEDDVDKPEPTHFSEIDLKTIKVAQLRDELRARNSSCKGLRAALVSRLSKLLKQEEDAEKPTGNDDVVLVEDEPETQDAPKEEVKEDKDDRKNEEPVEVKEDEGAKETAEDKKLAEKKPKTEKEIEEEKKKLEKEKQAIKSRYELPSSPAIIVHPSATAKAGKFNCTVASLSLLLDYRLTDNKEHSFELFVFAELFNEMMMRDFGFYVYKTLYTLPERVDETKDKKEDKTEKKDEKVEKKDDKAEKEKREEREKSDKKDEKRDEKRESRKRERRDSTKSEDGRSGGGVELPPDPYLLLSLIYFDTGRGACINKKDLQNLFVCLGLQLSRAQIRAVVDKACAKDTFTYKALAQSIKDLDKASTQLLQDLPLDTITNNLTEATMPEVPEEVAELETVIATGNRKLLPVFDRPSENGDVSKDTKEVSADGLVMYNSRLVDVGGLLRGVSRGEAERARLAAALSEARALARNMRAAHSAAAATASAASAQLGDLTAQLAKAHARNIQLTASSKLFHAALKSIQSKVETVINIKYEEEEVVDLVNGPTKTEKKEVKKEEKPSTNESDTTNAVEPKDDTAQKNEDSIKTNTESSQGGSKAEETVSTDVVMDVE